MEFIMQQEFLDSFKRLISRPLMLITVIFFSVIAVQLLINGKSAALKAALKALGDIVKLFKDGGWQLIIVLLITGLFWGKNR